MISADHSSRSVETNWNWSQPHIPPSSDSGSETLRDGWRRRGHDGWELVQSGGLINFWLRGEANLVKYRVSDAGLSLYLSLFGGQCPVSGDFMRQVIPVRGGLVSQQRPLIGQNLTMKPSHWPLSHATPRWLRIKITTIHWPKLVSTPTRDSDTYYDCQW